MQWTRSDDGLYHLDDFSVTLGVWGDDFVYAEFQRHWFFVSQFNSEPMFISPERSLDEAKGAILSFIRGELEKKIGEIDHAIRSL